MSPAAFSSRPEHHSGTKNEDLAHPPHPHLHKKLEPWRSVGNDPAAVVVLNGQRVGELTVFLDRAEALDRGPGKPVEVRGQGPRALAGSTESV